MKDLVIGNGRWRAFWPDGIRVADGAEMPKLERSKWGFLAVRRGVMRRPSDRTTATYE